MIQISDYKQILQQKNESLISEIKSKRVFVDINSVDFKEIFLLESKNEILKRGIQSDFIIDNNNKHIVNQLYFYLIGSADFAGNTNKGILIQGSIGAGKTIIMNAFCNIIENLSKKVITKIHSKKINEVIKLNDSGYLDKKPLFIDDLGREGKEINDFGTKTTPLIDLFSIRYDLGSWTFATTNFNADTLQEFYGEAIVDRFKEMFNFLTLTGKSKRC